MNQIFFVNLFLYRNKSMILVHKLCCHGIVRRIFNLWFLITWNYALIHRRYPEESALLSDNNMKVNLFYDILICGLTNYFHAWGSCQSVWWNVKFSMLSFNFILILYPFTAEVTVNVTLNLMIVSFDDKTGG